MIKQEIINTCHFKNKNRIKLKLKFSWGILEGKYYIFPYRVREIKNNLINGMFNLIWENNDKDNLFFITNKYGWTEQTILYKKYALLKETFFKKRKKMNKRDLKRVQEASRKALKKRREENKKRKEIKKEKIKELNLKLGGEIELYFHGDGTLKARWLK